MKKTITRLPGLDRLTRASESLTFLALGAVAAGLIGFALRDAAQFANARESLVSSWESQPAQPSAALASARTNHSFTNLTLSPVPSNDRHS